MTHYLTSDDKYRGLSCGGDRRPYFGRDRFGRIRGMHPRGHTALSRVNSYLKAMIEAIANSKLRRMERELELRGIRYHRPDDSRMRKSQPTRHSR
jgi:hypothetical protein